MIYVIDDILAKPGQGQALYDAYMARYVPGAEARGMTLQHRLVEPAMWLPEDSNRLIFIWVQPHAGAVWAPSTAPAWTQTWTGGGRKTLRR